MFFVLKNAGACIPNVAFITNQSQHSHTESPHTCANVHTEQLAPLADERRLPTIGTHLGKHNFFSTPHTCADVHTEQLAPLTEERRLPTAHHDHIEVVQPLDGPA